MPRISPYYDLFCSLMSLLLVSLCHEWEDWRMLLLLLLLLLLLRLVLLLWLSERRWRNSGCYTTIAGERLTAIVLVVVVNSRIVVVTVVDVDDDDSGFRRKCWAVG